MGQVSFVVATSLCLLGACSRIDPATPPATNAPIETDQQVYTYTEGAVIEVVATYVNRQPNPVYVPVCGEDLPFHHWEKYEDKKWRVEDSATGYGCASELITNAIAPGSRLTKRFYLFLPESDDVTDFYRLIWDVTDVPSRPEVEAVSNAFEIVSP